MKGFLVYVLYKSGEPVYIGRTKGDYNLKQRLYNHRRSGKEWDEYGCAEIDNYELCKETERKLIKQFEPRYNRQCLPGKIRYGEQRAMYRYGGHENCSQGVDK